ncbi:MULTISPECIES: hypothetical protein [Rhodomicrobium]|uniref:hypothetical protein n=1 Tax=Rhodomicrobium TaxID=1068 RepID=UPI000B4C1D93|nr:MULTISPECIES: hypothetical protein [Rhodomicrobium]
MKQVRQFCAIAILGAALPLGAAKAASEVLESSVPGLAVGAKLEDNARVKLPDGASLRVLVVSTGGTKTLKGPYEGTIEAYKEDRSWWERITGKGKDSDAPIGATRGFKAN